MAKRDEKKRREKEASAAIYINLTKQAIEVKVLMRRPSLAERTTGSCSPT
jgi:hypothetical protein